MPKAGFKLLQGQAAGDFWHDAQEDWIEQYETGKGVVRPAPAPEPVTDPVPVPDPVDSAEGVTRVRIAASRDDVEKQSSGKISFSSSDLELVDDGTVKPGPIVGLRFNEFDIPKGAVVTRAYVQFQVRDETSRALPSCRSGESARTMRLPSTAPPETSCRGPGPWS